jgi:hypothetical protein
LTGFTFLISHFRSQESMALQGFPVTERPQVENNAGAGPQGASFSLSPSRFLCMGG